MAAFSLYTQLLLITLIALCILVLKVYIQLQNIEDDQNLKQYQLTASTRPESLNSASQYRDVEFANERRAIVTYLPGGKKSAYRREVQRILGASWWYSQSAALRAHSKKDLSSNLQNGQKVKNISLRSSDILIFSEADAVYGLPTYCGVVNCSSYTPDNVLDQNDFVPDRSNTHEALKLKQSSCLKRVLAKQEQLRSLRMTPDGISTCVAILHHNRDDDEWVVPHDYRFMHSINFLIHPVYQRLFLHYDYLFKTDLDVFFTPSWPSYTVPEGKSFVVGGGWYGVDETLARLKLVSKRLGLMHRGYFNVGASWFASSESIISVANTTVKLARHFLNEEFTHVTGIKHKWPYWHKGVTSMYASDLAINHLISRSQLQRDPKTIDAEAESHGPIDGVVHIHCRLNSKKGYFKKVDFHAGKLSPETHPRKTLSGAIISDYVFLIAIYGEADNMHT